MGKRGPAPKPTALKIVQGNPGKQKLNDKEPKPPKTKNPKPPIALSKQQKKYWKLYTNILTITKVLTDADLMLLARYCDGLEDWTKLRENKVKFGRAVPKYEWVRNYITNKDGTKSVEMVRQLSGFIKNPDAQAFTELSRDLLKMEQELGLTPASRSRVLIESGQKGVNEEDELDDYLFGTR